MDRPDGDIATIERPESRAERPQERPAAPVEPSAPAPRRRRGLGWLVVLAILAGLGWAGWRFVWPRIQADRAEKAEHGRRGAGGAPQPVGVAVIGTGDLRVVLTGIGTVTPLATITVQTQISGQLLDVGYKEGQMVRKGDFLAQIDPHPYEIALEQAEGALAHDTGLLNQAKSDLERYNTLNRQDSIARQTFADQQFVVQQDEGLIKEDQAQIDTAKLNLVYCHIVAPVAGRVGLRLVDPGNYVQASSSTGLVVIAELQPISVIFDLPEHDVPDVQRAMDAGETLGVAAYDRTDTQEIAAGTLTTVDNTVDTTTGTVKLRANFPNADDGLFPNQFVNARLLLKTLHGVVRAPVAAVQHGEPGSYVYRVKPDGTVSVVTVKTGVTDGDFVQILDGLAPGDEVVVDGTDRLREGARVRVTPDPADPEATPVQPAPAGTGEGRRARHEGAAKPDDAGPPAGGAAPAGGAKPDEGAKDGTPGRGERRHRRRDGSGAGQPTP